MADKILNKTAAQINEALGGAYANMAIGGYTVNTVFNNLYFKANNGNGTRCYIIPDISTGVGLRAGLKIFGTDYSVDQTNYFDFGIYASDEALIFNSKSAGTESNRNFQWMWQDTNKILELYHDGSKGMLKGDAAIFTNTIEAQHLKATGIGSIYNDNIRARGSGINAILETLQAGADLFIRANDNVIINDNGSVVLIGSSSVSGTHKLQVTGTIKGDGFVCGANVGVDGTFTTADAKTVTVTKGIVTSIV